MQQYPSDSPPESNGSSAIENEDLRQNKGRNRFLSEQDESQFYQWIRSNAPIELEVGSGKGLFITQAAKENPTHHYLGLELATKYALECQTRIEKLKISNARFFACDAVAVLDRDVPDACLYAVHVYFPDPWWKSRHKKRRVLNERTLRNIERCLQHEGTLHFWTDVLDYYESTLDLIGSTTQLDGPFFVGEPAASHDMDYRTHFERRTRRNGLPVYRSRFVKRQSH